MNDGWGFMAGVVCLLLGWFGGCTAKDVDWRTDCQRINAHVSISGGSYECKLVKENK